MKYFKILVAWLGTCPDWVALLLPVCALSVCAVLVAVFGKRKLYPFFAFGWWSVGMVLICAKEEIPSAVVWSAFYFVLSLLLRLLFLVPVAVKKRESPEKKLFAEMNDFLRFEEKIPDLPPTTVSPGSNADLNHAMGLLDKLRKKELSPSDRLETDMLSSTLCAFQKRELSCDEVETLNDCLACILKLSAKYAV